MMSACDKYKLIISAGSVAHSVSQLICRSSTQYREQSITWWLPQLSATDEVDLGRGDEQNKAHGGDQKGNL